MKHKKIISLSILCIMLLILPIVSHADIMAGDLNLYTNFNCQLDIYTALNTDTTIEYLSQFYLSLPIGRDRNPQSYNMVGCDEYSEFVYTSSNEVDTGTNRVITQYGCSHTVDNVYSKRVRLISTATDIAIPLTTSLSDTYLNLTAFENVQNPEGYDKILNYTVICYKSQDGEGLVAHDFTTLSGSLVLEADDPIMSEAIRDTIVEDIASRGYGVSFNGDGINYMWLASLSVSESFTVYNDNSTLFNISGIQDEHVYKMSQRGSTQLMYSGLISVELPDMTELGASLAAPLEAFFECRIYRNVTIGMIFYCVLALLLVKCAIVLFAGG